MTIRPLAEETVQDEEETQPAPNLAVAAVQTAPPPRTAEIPQVLIEPIPSPQSPPKQSAVAQEELRTEANIEEAKVDHAQVQSPSPIVAPSIETSLNSAAPKEDPPAIKQTDAELKTPAPSATPAAKENRPTISSAIPEATEPPSPPPQAAQSLAVPDEQTRAEQKEAPAALPASISEPTPPETPTQSDSTNIPNSTPTPAVTPAQALLPTPPGRSGAVKYALIGLALLALFGLLWLKKKSPRHSRPSIISQSLDRPRH